MINAKDALDLYNNSLHTLQQYLLDNFHSGIQNAARNGKREFILDCGSEMTGYGGITPKMTPLQEKARDELKKLGYETVWMWYGDAYVPKGLADDDGSGPKYMNYGLKVRW